MFNDKKLRNMFLLELLIVVVPTLLLVIANIMESTLLGVIYLILGIIGLFVSIGIFRRFIRNWKTWNPPVIRIIGLVLSILGILLGLYAILGLYSFMVYIVSPAAALL
jgi:hypothetical protein